MEREDTYDWEEENKAFDKSISQLSFPSDDITWGTLRKNRPDLCHEIFSGNPSLGKAFPKVLEYEYQLANNIFIREKHGTDAFNAMHADGPISECIATDIETLKKCYEAAGMYQGEVSFKEQIRRIEDSVKAYVQSLSK